VANYQLMLWTRIAIANSNPGAINTKAMPRRPELIYLNHQCALITIRAFYPMAVELEVASLEVELKIQAVVAANPDPLPMA